MKKLLLLCLVLLGGVLQVSADDTWSLRGDFNSWSGTANIFTNNQTTVSLEEGKLYKFKVVKNDGSNDTWYSLDDQTITYLNYTTNWTIYTNKGDFPIKTSDAGTYTFTINTSGGNPSITVTYPTPYTTCTVYLYNNFTEWSAPYAYPLTFEKWNNSTSEGGTGSLGSVNGIAMTQEGSSNVWKADYRYAGSTYIAFVKSAQDNYDKFWENEAIYRGDLTKKSRIFVPSTTDDPVTTNKTKYFNVGAWHDFPTYTRSVTEGNFGTLCLPFDATVTGATVYEISGKVMSGETLTGINLSPVTNLTAGVAYIFKATGSTLTATLSGNYSDAIPANGMMGNLSSEKVTVTNGNYIVKDNQIRLVGDGSTVTCGQYRGYITLADIAPATARSANFMGFEDETTGIANVDVNANDNIDANAPMYNLAGQRVTKNYKGVVIVNGKKVVLK